MQVTIPVEQHREGSGPSDSEEDFDRERQHSVLPHKAGDQPFRSKILSLEDDGMAFPAGNLATGGVALFKFCKLDQPLQRAIHMLYSLTGNICNQQKSSQVNLLLAASSYFNSR